MSINIYISLYPKKKKKQDELWEIHIKLSVEEPDLTTAYIHYIGIR
jgi:hypothetical protein